MAQGVDTRVCLCCGRYVALVKGERRGSGFIDMPLSGQEARTEFHATRITHLPGERRLCGSSGHWVLTMIGTVQLCSSGSQGWAIAADSRGRETIETQSV